MIHDADTWALVCADSLEFLATLPECSIDSVVTDPPYELTSAKRTSPPPEGAGPFARHRVGANGDHRPVGGFMGKEWDGTGISYSVDLWREVLRTLKPGAHLLAFGGTRTYHRMACAIEDAGFEVRDSLHWMYGTGFPKSLNLGDGRGSALKPGHEPVVMARKPLIGTLEKNVEQWGTGGLRIDETRLERAPDDVWGWSQTGSIASENVAMSGGNYARDPKPDAAGRWPANVLLDEDAASELDAQTATLKQGGRLSGNEPGSRAGQVALGNLGARPAWEPYGDSGGASRFFYVAKAGRKERDLGCDHLPAKTGGEATHREDGTAGVDNPRAGAGRTGGAKNHHPTVKPIALMRYLVRLVTPRGGLVLDPFTGSGTTGAAALREGLRFLGVEKEPEYFEIAKARISAAIPFEEAA